MPDPKEGARWRRAHAGISVPEVGLGTMAPFPSLYAQDFTVYLESRGSPPEVVRFLSDMRREIAWVYDNWQKAQTDGNPKAFIEAMLNDAAPTGAAAGGGPAPDYSGVRKFLRDYAASHGIVLGSEEAERPSWMGAMGKVAEGTGMAVIGDDPIFPQARPVALESGPIVPPGPMKLEEAADALLDR